MERLLICSESKIRIFRLKSNAPSRRGNEIVTLPACILDFRYVCSRTAYLMFFQPDRGRHILCRTSRGVFLSCRKSLHNPFSIYVSLVLNARANTIATVGRLCVLIACSTSSIPGFVA